MTISRIASVLTAVFAIGTLCGTTIVLTIIKENDRKTDDISALKLEIGSLRSAMDSAAVLADEKGGKIVVIRKDDDATLIRVTFNDYPTKEFLVRVGGEVHAITRLQDESIVSDHVATWGEFAKWRRN